MTQAFFFFPLRGLKPRWKQISSPLDANLGPASDSTPGVDSDCSPAPVCLGRGRFKVPAAFCHRRRAFAPSLSLHTRITALAFMSGPVISFSPSSSPS